MHLRTRPGNVKRNTGQGNSGGWVASCVIEDIGTVLIDREFPNADDAERNMRAVMAYIEERSHIKHSPGNGGGGIVNLP